MKHARLPVELVKKTIGDLEPGESTWTYPWAVQVDQEGYMYIDLCYAQGKQGGTSQLHVAYNENREYVATLHDKKFRYRRERLGSGQLVSLDEFIVR